MQNIKIILASKLMGQKLDIYEADKIINLLKTWAWKHYDIVTIWETLEFLAKLINEGNIKVFNGRILCCMPYWWAYNLETDELIQGEELKRILNLAFNEGAMRDYGKN